MRRGFTPLQTKGRHKKDMVSVMGFTLIEIMIVVAIVIVLLTLAVPNILRSRVIANEGAALGNLRAINNGCQLYHINEEKYPESLSALAQTDPPYLDPNLASGEKQGYNFTYSRVVDNDHFTVNANPISTGLLEGRYFYLDESGIIRFRSDTPAGPSDESIR